MSNITYTISEDIFVEWVEYDDSSRIAKVELNLNCCFTAA
jgi:hypothetical protein